MSEKTKIPKIVNEIETFICQRRYNTESIEDKKEGFPDEIEKNRRNLNYLLL